jgi:hypothetical protein
MLKYHGGLHIYIQAEMDILDISSLGVTYRYVVKIEKNIKQKTRKFGPGNHSHRKEVKGSPNPKKRDRENMDNLRTTILGCKQTRTLKRQRKILGSCGTSIRAPDITLLISAQTNCWWMR